MYKLNSSGLSLALQSIIFWKIAFALASHLAQGHINTIDLTFSGCRIASCWAMILPIEQPTTLTFSICRVSSNPA